MRVRIRHPLFAGFLGLLAVLVSLIVFLAGTGLRRQLEGFYRAELARELSLGAEMIRMSPDLHPDTLAGLVASRLEYRVSILDSAGAVLGDSQVDVVGLARMRPLTGRSELAEAWQGRIGFAEEDSPSGPRLLYAAAVVPHRGGSVALRLTAPLDPVDRAVGRAQAAVAAAGLLAALVAVALAYLLTHLLTRPLIALRERAVALSNGDFSRRMPRHLRVAELDELAAAFNRLAEQVASRFGELGRERDEMQALIDTMAEGVIALNAQGRVLRINRAARDVLQIPEPPAYALIGTLVRQRDLRDLLEDSATHPFQAREINIGLRHFIASSRLLERGGSVTTLLDVTEIRRLEQMRRDFVANVSHELKTPLTSVRGFAETLLEDDPPADLRRQFLERIRGNTLRLQRLVDDLLDLSRLESGGWMAKVERVEVAAVAREAWEALESRAREKGIAFVVEGHEVALADADGLAQVFQNLLDNALRYTSEGRIRVGMSRRDRTLEVSVEDTGMGIPARSLARIFERFYRVDSARSREAGGTGLGLAIVRHLVQEMGGEVSASSELGKGTTIRFTLPAAPPGLGDTGS